MSTLTKMTRTVKKLEVPRPLKSTTSSAHNRNSVLDVKINSGNYLIYYNYPSSVDPISFFPVKFLIGPVPVP